MWNLLFLVVGPRSLILPYDEDEHAIALRAQIPEIPLALQSQLRGDRGCAEDKHIVGLLRVTEVILLPILVNLLNPAQICFKVHPVLTLQRLHVARLRAGMGTGTCGSDTHLQPSFLLEVHFHRIRRLFASSYYSQTLEGACRLVQ